MQYMQQGFVGYLVVTPVQTGVLLLVSHGCAFCVCLHVMQCVSSAVRGVAAARPKEQSGCLPLLVLPCLWLFACQYVLQLACSPAGGKFGCVGL